MAQQLIFTSVPRGFQPGASGYCTAARSEQMRTGLVQRLEQMSVYSHRTASPNPTILAYRLVDLGGAKYRVLSRIRDAGLDFTQRSNFIAHHLAFEPGESAGGASPAEILLFWDGWKDQWEGNPSPLQDDKGDAIGSSVRRLSPPCKHWEDLTGDSGWGAFPWNQSGGCCWLHEKLDEFELLHLMGESLRLKSSDKQDALWETSFTTYLGTIVEASKYQWSAWNVLDPLPTGKELGKNIIRVESLKGDPIGNKELIEIARGGYPAISPTSSVKQTRSTPKEVKTQPHARVSKEVFQRRESTSRAVVSNTKNKQSYLLALLTATAATIVAVGYFFFERISEENKKASDVALIQCIDSISENLSAGEMILQDQDYDSDLTKDMLRPFGDKEKEAIKALDRGVRNLKKDKESVESVREKLGIVRNIAITDEPIKKLSTLEMRIIQWNLEKQKQQETKLKQEISEKIKQLTESSNINYENDLSVLQGLKREWNLKSKESFPYENIFEIIEIAKQLPSKSSAGNEEYTQLLERLEGFKNIPDAVPYVSKIIRYEKERRKDTDKALENIDSNRTTSISPVFNEETRKHEKLMLDSFFSEDFREKVFKDFPAATVNYILVANLSCPGFMKESQAITNLEVSNYKKTALKTTDVFSEKGLFKDAYRSKSKSGLVLVCKNQNKANIVVFKTEKPSPLIIQSTWHNKEIFNSLDALKYYLNKTIIWDSKGNDVLDAKGRDALRWSISCADTGKVIITNLMTLDPDVIRTINNTSSAIRKKECLNEFKRINPSLTEEKIENLWQANKNGLRWEELPDSEVSKRIKEMDGVAKAYLTEKDDFENRSNSPSQYSNLKENELAKKVKESVQEVIKNSKGLLGNANNGQMSEIPDILLNQLGKDIHLKVNQLREYLLMSPSKELAKISFHDYEEISKNKDNLAVIANWRNYRDYIMSIDASGNGQPQSDSDWFIENVLSGKKKYELFLGDADLQYFQICE